MLVTVSLVQMIRPGQGAAVWYNGNVEQRENGEQHLSTILKRNTRKEEEGGIPWWYKRNRARYTDIDDDNVGAQDDKRDRDEESGIPWWYKKNIDKRT